MNWRTTQLLLARIEQVMRTRRMPPSRFGREAIGDPRLVFDLQNGRRLRRSTAGRVRAYLERLEAALPPSATPESPDDRKR